MLDKPEFLFVLPNRTQAELTALSEIQVDKDWRAFEGGVSAWILQTYLLLRDQEQRIRLTNQFQSQAINIVHMADLATKPRQSDFFFVGVQADYPPLKWCNFRIVQNQSQVGRNSAWVCHWPQPGLIPRSDGRQSVERVGYLGREINHYTRYFRRASGYARVREKIERACKDVGLVLDPRGADRWNDFSDIDIAIGIRSLNRASFRTKPPTKMLNAWLAGVPFIGGYDCAYSRLSGMDAYIRVASYERLKKALETLRSNKDYYEKLTEAGRAAALPYTRSATRQVWQKLLRGQITDCFSKWYAARAADARP